MTPRYVLLVKPITFPIFPHTKLKQTGRDVIENKKYEKKLIDNADLNFFLWRSPGQILHKVKFFQLIQLTVRLGLQMVKKYYRFCPEIYSRIY